MNSILNLALNNPNWQVKKGIGSFLTFDMGERVTSKKRNGNIYYSGSIHLWIYLCEWTITRRSKILATSNASDNIIKSSLELINNNMIFEITQIK